MARGDFIRFASVSKAYDGNHAVVRALDLCVREGEFLTLLGPSGCGKTTTLMMLAGFEAPTHGEIHLDGERIDRVPPHRRNIGMVFQNYALFPHMTVAQNVAFPLQMRHLANRQIRERVGEALEMVRLQPYAHRRPAQLSGGQQQRVALARALVYRPSLILMDEPLSALDKQLREQMQWEIKQLHARVGITVVYVTHDQAEALTMSDRIGVMNEGVLQQLATPADLYDNPANAFVARFVGENNALTAQVAAIEGGHCTLRLPDGSLVQARAGAGLREGQAASLTLRPEKIVIAPAAAAGWNTAPAQIAGVVYCGDHLRVRVDSCGLGGVLIKAPTQGAGAALAAGGNVTIGWMRDHCLALPLH
ncbi:ABC transporter ATP-binding protein [Cupriavidus gilardii]|uniref:ABC transporter ATP-binding protein n=1 Tax=Cupriavidus gilardii TaxID=82541 RepID=UPI001EE561F0|nr:ABC transporter ATP-binding protein [Cupriavidus gilardii]MCG5260638.1 ABC transporter ATP-binding protein [Cupriavidus gilardii]MDF9431847.1 ABC transporter ATP-binding protein [Cupriavidus gilardii]